MAILNIVDGLTASILINGDPAVEYDDPDEIQVEHENNAIREYQIKHTVSKYIESQSGQKFSIQMKVGRPLGHANMAHAKLTMDVEVDGIPVWELICDRPWFKKHPEGAEWEDVVAGPKDNKGKACTTREFLFLKIQTSSDITKSSIIKRQKARMEKKGTIVVKVYNSTAGRSGGPTIVVPEKDGFLQRHEANVSEKAVKGTAKSHAAILGKAKKTARGPVFRTKKKDGEDYPVAIFRFIYRDLDALKQMHVISRDPSSSPPPSSPTGSPNGSPATSSASAAAIPPVMPTFSDKMVLEMYALWQKTNGVHPEPKSNNKRKVPKVKKENGEKRGLNEVARGPAKKLKVDKNGVIDLISDGEEEEEAAATAPEQATDVVDAEGDAEVESRHAGRDVSKVSDDGKGLFVPQRRR
ncbi:hypothetical protein BKA65DRAFT_599288 [Rhexocercosporidium sp. MPI-PUGE-AT-0058]|nr:hypothetical protein BKA65DRAFT_599288 [Rhexocercosporidium sp. MPI-PUGE-AT-0058]